MVLAFHNVVPDGAPRVGDRSLHLPLSTFREVLELASSLAEVVPLAAVHDRPAEAPPAIALTFDDCYAGFVELGVPELIRSGLPATIFVAPGILGGRTMWWDALAGEEGLSDAARAHALGALRGDDAEILAWARAAGLPIRTLPEAWRTASEAQCDALCTHRALTLASHTWSHPNLAALPPAGVAEELARAASWLGARGPTVDAAALAYPYGLAPDPAVRAATVPAGTRAYAVSGGWLGGDTPERTLLPRLNVPHGLSRQGLALRLSGMPLPT